MELTVIREDASGKDKRKITGYFLHVTREEAMRLIISLSQQINDNNANSNRLESYTNDGKYFSIAVEPVPPETPIHEKLLDELPKWYELFTGTKMSKEGIEAWKKHQVLRKGEGWEEGE